MQHVPSELNRHCCASPRLCQEAENRRGTTSVLASTRVSPFSICLNQHLSSLLHVRPVVCQGSFAAPLLEGDPIKPRVTGSSKCSEKKRLPLAQTLSCKWSYKMRLPPEHRLSVSMLSSLLSNFFATLGLRKSPLFASPFRTRRLQGFSQDHLFGNSASALFQTKTLKAGLHLDVQSDGKFNWASARLNF